MNSKFLVLTGCLFFTFGCSHTNMEVAKTDFPEDDIIAGESVAPRPHQEVASIEQKEVGYSDFSVTKKQSVRRGLASATMAKGGSRDDEAQERSRNSDEAIPGIQGNSSDSGTQLSDTSGEDRRPFKCNTLAYAKARLGFKGFTGNAGESMPAWLKAGYSKIEAGKKANDFCVFSGGPRGYGTIVMKNVKGWSDGCHNYDTLPHGAGYSLVGCVRPVTVN